MGSRSDIHEKNIFKIDSVPKRLLQMLNTRNVSKTKIDQNLFSYVTLYFATQRADLIPFFCIPHQPNSVTTVLLHYEIVSSF